MNQSTHGFTIVELTTAIAVFAILITIAWSDVSFYIANARDNERASDSSAIARSFEHYYRSHVSSDGSPTYPDASQIDAPSELSQIINATDERLVSPGSTSISLSATTTTTPPVPTFNQYIYQPFTKTDVICTDSDATPCVRFMLYYRIEQSDQVKTTESIHQQ